MSKGKKIWKVGSWIGGTLFLLLLLGFAKEKREETVLKNLHFSIKHPSGQLFLTIEDVHQLIASEADTTANVRLSEINIALLEESIENHPLILSAEVYSNLSGGLFVDVVQKEALARVLGDTERYYIDVLGERMPLSPHYSAPVPLVSGRMDSVGMSESLKVLKACREDADFWPLLAGVDVRENGTVRIFTRMGSHEILIGRTTDLEEKIKKLKAFYEYGIDKNELPQLKRIDLRFNRQVVVQKK